MQIKYCASPHYHSPHTLATAKVHLSAAMSCCPNCDALMSQFLLEAPNVLLCNFCIFHSSNQHIPCWGLGAFASAPSGQPILDYFFIIQGIGGFACVYCGLVKPHSFKDCPRFACSFSAHMYSEEHDMVWTICRESKTLHIHAMPCTHIHTCMQTVTDLHTPHTTGSTTHQPQTTQVGSAMLVPEAVLPSVVAESVL